MYEEYVVKSGDTVYGISSQYGIKAVDLANLNNLENFTIQIGQVLKIPSKQGANPSGYFTYTVKKGDSLYKIAKVYETTVDDIIQANNLKSNALQIGQKLRIPEGNFTVITKPSYSTYTVKKGDSLYSIARKYGVDVNTIMKDNGLKTNVLAIGQVLNIRTPKEEVNVLECYGEEYTPKPNYVIYTVKAGDNLYSIAKKYNTDVASIKRKNNLTSNNLSIGQQLKI